MIKRVAIAAGGDSGEYEVSLKSAEIVRQSLDPEKYDAYLLIIRGGQWFFSGKGAKQYPVNKDDFSLMVEGRKITFDVVFIAIHGTPGEDGKLQGYFDMLGIPYTSSGQVTSALTFDKDLCKRVVASLGIRVAPSITLGRADSFDTTDIINTAGLPCFVKPNKGGSSVGMSKVSKAEDLAGAIHRALAEDDQVMVEAFIPGREITCGVITSGKGIQSLPVTEIITRNEFFDYEAKYTDGVTDEITPADIPSEISLQCRQLSEMLYRKLNCRGFVRCDYIYNNEGMFFLEVNTVPGLSPNSILPQQAGAEGISLQQLFSMAIEQALRD
jgi:D-alanine-D-alanine ligase